MPSPTLKQNRLIQSFVRAGIAIDFDNLHAHCVFLAKGLESERTRFEKFVEKEAANLTDEDRDAFFDYFSDDAWRINDVFPALLSTSAFLLSYGMFEKSLNEICRSAKRKTDIDIFLKDLNGQGIERAKSFLSKICGVSAPFNTSEWREIVNLSRLRNVMAHTSGVLDLTNSNHKQVLAYCQGQPTINIKKHEVDLQFAEIELTLECVSIAVKSFRGFLISVCNQNADN